MTLKLTLALVMAFITAVIVGRFYVPWLKKIKAGQEIKENGPTWHMSKSGTPTMGGVIFISACTLVCLTVGFDSMRSGDFTHIFVLLFALVFGVIGFLDDWEKLRKKQNLGLSAKAKFLLQLVAALVFVLLLRKMGYISTHLYIPFWNVTVYIPEVIYFILAAFIIVGTVNAVNITDGVDGLASGTSIPVCLFFAAVSFLWGDKYMALGIFASALLGGLMGFLVYNFNPAKVFMGDTGSLFLGGAIAALAFAYDMPLILITLGIVYIIETLSDIIQVTYFKLTHGKRVFKMAPFHHHLEMGGWTGKKWKEKELFALFTSVSLVFAIISFIGIYNRFQL
ncbi:MAG: phospho-N-acetylmuramoyl-pentapeptide-transferase [Clostridiales bacterium]|nr:phospho-N-acetylmuramoyl-pentapeptide-transferase [Clostridiales bacterium]MDY4143586.1 phospho-N-acetylmuramoyl-pentapeptide-transferase [Oscillospiraceae bacterium]